MLMKKLMITAGITCVILVLTVAFTIGFSLNRSLAQPERATSTVWYDSAGNEIGWVHIRCDGPVQASGDTTGDIYITDLGEQCDVYVEPIGCSDLGLYTVGSSCSETCVSAGYMMSYNGDMVPDCWGMCIDNQFMPCDGCNNVAHPSCPNRPPDP